MYDLLNGVYSWFTEGFTTGDLQEAKAVSTRTVWEPAIFTNIDSLLDAQLSTS